MKILVRQYTDEDYPMLKTWWEGHGWPAVPQDILRPIGIIVEIDDVPAAAAWLYLFAGVGACIMEWTVTNPENSSKASLRAIGHIHGAMEEIAKAHDYGVMFTTCKQESLAKVHAKNGFKETDRDMIHMVKFIERGDS